MENQIPATMFEEFLNLYKFINRPIVAKRLIDELPEEIHRKVYELSDGERTSRNIAAEAGINHVTVTKYWKKWAMAGIVVPAKRAGRFMKTIDLKGYGMTTMDDAEDE